MKAGTARIMRCSVLSIILAFTCPWLPESGKMSTVQENTFIGREMTCVIVLGDDMRGAHGLESGFCYELLKKFASDNFCTVTAIVDGRDAASWVDSLRAGKIDIMVLHHDAHAGQDGISFSRRITPCTSWATNGTDISGLRQIDRWICHVTETEEYACMREKYFRTFNPHKRAERGEISRIVSPYDDLIKKYASGIGWDWRMLAAVVYQESKFSISSISHKGASGLMQVMPHTAEYYSVSDLTDPDQNLLAGTSHLKRLQRIFRKYGMEGEELIKFTLAAYNAGEGRVMDCRSFAASRQADTNVWDEVARLIPLMREDFILEEESVRLGKFNGDETLEYVDSVISYYEAICRICPGA